MVSADGLQRRHVIPLDHFGELLGNLLLGEADAVAGDIEVNGILEIQALLHILAQGVEVRKDFLVHLHAVAFHAAAPVVIAGAVFGGFEDSFHHRPLQGLVDLFSKFPFQRECGVEGGHMMWF